MARRKMYAVWESEYPDEGSVLIRAHDVREAKRQYEAMITGDCDRVALTAELMDKKSMALRRAIDLLDDNGYFVTKRSDKTPPQVRRHP